MGMASVHIDTMPRARVSIVVPVLDEGDNVRRLCVAIRRTLSAIDSIKYEIIFVDDGSRDRSWEIIGELHRQDARVKGVRLSRNFGHQAALTAGYRYASGDAIITMDGDMQHPPDMLPLMIEKWREGYEVVSMVREQSAHEGWFKRLSSKLFYRLINVLSDVAIRESVADFRLLDRRVVRRLNSLRERTRFVRGLISWLGFSEIELKYQASPRHSGKTKYSLRKMFGLAGSAVSSFSTVPLKLIFYAGLAVNTVCLGLMGYAVYNKIHEHKDLTEWASTFMTMLFLSGVQMVMIGLIGLYLGRVLEEVKRRPVYVTREALGIERRRKNAAARALRVRSA